MIVLQLFCLRFILFLNFTLPVILCQYDNIFTVNDQLSTIVPPSDSNLFYVQAIYHRPNCSPNARIWPVGYGYAQCYENGKAWFDYLVIYREKREACGSVTGG
jgi:hypothetical protein